MTGQEIIEANADLLREARISKIGGLPCVIGINPDNEEMAIFWRGDVHVDVATKTTRHRGSMREIHRILKVAQPGKQFATVADDELAATFKASHIPFYVDDERRVHPGRAPL